MAELKPCPFCGGEGAIVNFKPHRPDGYWQGLCRKCSIQTCYHVTQEKAKTAWNRRTAPVKEVVYGEWIPLHSEFSPIRSSYFCNICRGYSQHKLNYCGDCGADMRGVK